MQEITPYKEGRKEVPIGGTAEMSAGSLKTEPGKITYGQVLQIEFVVAATGAATLTATQREAVLASILATFKPSHSLKEKITSYDAEELLDIREDCKRLLRRDFKGVDDATTGLATTFGAGETKTLTVTAYIPTAYAAMVRGARKVMGMGYGQMLDSSMVVKLASDAFKTATSNVLSLSKVYFTFGPLWDRGHRRFIGVPLITSRLVNAKSKSIETEPGFIASLEQMTPLATTALGELTVTVGEGDNLQTVANDATPAAIQAQYEDVPTTEAVEKTIKAKRTPLRVVGETELAQLKLGKVAVTQESLSEEWEVREARFPYLSTAQVFDLVAAEAKLLPKGKLLLAVNAAVYDGVDVNAEQLPLSGMVCFTSDEDEFYEYAGLVCESGGRPSVRIPPDKLRDYGRRIAMAMEPSRQFPKGDTGRVNGIRVEAGWSIPALVVHPEGLEYVSAVAEAVAAQLEEATAEAEQVVRQARESLGAAQKLALANARSRATAEAAGTKAAGKKAAAARR